MAKYNVHVQLIGHDGNAFAVLGRVRRALLDEGVDRAIIDDFTTEATSGDYDNLLRTVARWVEVE